MKSEFTTKNTKEKINLDLRAFRALRGCKLPLWCLVVFLCGQAGASVSTNKTLMLNNWTGGYTNNVLPPDATNFFVVNSNLLNQAIGPGSGISGVSSVNGQIGAITAVLTNGNAGPVTLNTNLNVGGNLVVTNNIVLTGNETNSSGQGGKWFALDNQGQYDGMDIVAAGAVDFVSEGIYNFGVDTIGDHGGTVQAGLFNGSGAGLTALVPAALTGSGTVPTGALG